MCVLIVDISLLSFQKRSAVPYITVRVGSFKLEPCDNCSKFYVYIHMVLLRLFKILGGRGEVALFSNDAYMKMFWLTWLHQSTDSVFVTQFSSFPFLWTCITGSVLKCDAFW